MHGTSTRACSRRDFLKAASATAPALTGVTAIRDLTAGHHRALPFYLGSFVIQGECDVDVSPGRYRVIAERRLEYTRGEQSVAVGGDGVTGVTLQLHLPPPSLAVVE